MISKYASLTILLLMTTFFMLAGCGNNPADSNQQNPEIALIKQVIQQDQEMFDVSGFDDDGAQDPSYDSDGLGKPTDPTIPLKYGRRGHFELDSIQVVLDTDTTATATIVHSLNGEFIILALDTTDTSFTIKKIKKPMTNTITRKAKLVKVDTTGDPIRDWKITKVSLAVARSDDPTITIQEMRIDLPNTEEDLVITDPLEVFLDRHVGLPTLSRGDTIKAYVTLTNSNDFPPEPGTTVTLRHRVHFFHRARKAFNDEGEYPDKVAGDGIFSAAFVVGSRFSTRFGLHHVGVDIIDNGTIYDDSAPYNSVIWAAPYMVRR